MLVAETAFYVAVACGERRRTDDRVKLFSSNAHTVSFCEVREAAPYLPATGVEAAILADFSTVPEVLSVSFAHEEGDTVVRLMVDQPARDVRYRIYDKQASLIEAFPSVDLNFMLVQAE